MLIVPLFSALFALAAAHAAWDDKLAKLVLAPNAVARTKLLSDADHVFDFLDPNAMGLSRGRGGLSVSATGTTFPALIGQGMAATVGYLGPCGMNTPHIHPRSPEFNMLTAGGPFLTGHVNENGARVILNVLELNQATLFPQGAIHFEQNLGCTAAQFVAVFRDEDPGVSQVAQRFQDLPPEVQSAVLGYPATQELLDLANMTQANIAFGTEECLRRCGIDPRSLPQVELNQRKLLEAAMKGTAAVFVDGSRPLLDASNAPPPRLAANANARAAVKASDTSLEQQLVSSRDTLDGAESVDFWHDAGRLKTAFIATLSITGALGLLLAVLGLALVLRRPREGAHRPLLDHDQSEVKAAPHDDDQRLLYADPLSLDPKRTSYA